jgi:ADP-L-glycero-D-manno-heptose 6-epimerase
LVNNFEYSKLLAKWALEKNIPFIYASSAATYGNGQDGFIDDESLLTKLRPINRYGYSKHLFDLWASKNALFSKIAGLKFFNVFGPNEYHKGDMRSVICKAYRQILSTNALKLFKSHRSDYEHGEQKRDFIYIKDCVEVIWWLLKNPKITGLFNLGSGQARTWNDLANTIFRAMQKKVKIEYIDMPTSIREQYQYFTQAEMKKLKDRGCLLNCTSLEEGIEDYVGNYLIKNQYL